MPLTKKNFQELWGQDSVKHPIPLDATTGWILYRELPDDSKDICIKEKTKRVTGASEKDINDFIVKAIKAGILATEIVLEETERKAELLLEKANELDIPKSTQSRIARFGKDPVEETYQDIDTNGLRRAIIKHPEILAKVFPDLID